MTLALAEVLEDPTHPEGGHALVVLQGIAAPAGEATLVVEPLTEGVDYRGPKETAITTSVTQRGLEFGIGPDIVSNLPPGVAVCLTLREADLSTELLWPTLRPLRAAPTRARLSAKPRRAVVEATERKPSSPVSRAGTGERPQGPREAKEITAVAEATNGRVGNGTGSPSSSASASLPDAITAIEGKDAAQPVTPLTGSREAVVQSLLHLPTADPVEKRRGASPLLLGATGVLAFLAGAGSVGLLWALSPAPPVPRPEASLSEVRLPSPFEALNSLTDQSPNGSRVKIDDELQFLQRARKAASPKEMSFWKRWAMRSMLRSNRSGAAATLSDFANDLASSHPSSDRPASAAARFVWEMAAIGCDCAAMENIARSLEEAGGPENLALAQTWRARSQQCHLDKGGAERACPKP